MTKNILSNDVVHHMRNMMLSRWERPLRELRLGCKVTLSCLSGASCLFADGLTSLCKAFLPENKARAIKLNLTEMKVF